MPNFLIARLVALAALPATRLHLTCTVRGALYSLVWNRIVYKTNSLHLLY
jgi:hypothetical protein